MTTSDSSDSIGSTAALEPPATPTPVFIMAVPWEPRRVHRVKTLRVDAGQPCEVVWDEEHDAMDTWLRLLARIDAGPTRSGIVLEDDVQLTVDWRLKVEAVIRQVRDAPAPNALIQFYSARKADLTRGSRWEPGRSYLMNQCHYLPPGMAHDLLGFAPGWIDAHPEHPTGHDLLIADFLRSTGQRYWLQVPSLVQHEPWRSEINPRRSSARQSPTFEPI